MVKSGRLLSMYYIFSNLEFKRNICFFQNCQLTNFDVLYSSLFYTDHNYAVPVYYLFHRHESFQMLDRKFTHILYTNTEIICV